jgi:predicted amidohydrolase
VLDPMGVEIAGLGDTDGVVTAEISPERVSSVRETLPVLFQRRYEVRTKS